MTINDGYGNANLTFNHTNGTPEQNGRAGRIEVNTDSTSGDATMSFELGSATANTAAGITQILQLSNGTSTFSSSAGLTFNNRPAFNGGASGSTSPFTVDSTTKVTNLNADLLDDLSSGSFLRSDANDTFTGTITGNTLRLGDSQIISSSAKLQVNGFQRTGTIYLHEGTTPSTTEDRPLSNNAGILEWDGNEVWTAGNDGAGSGLDADLLDGLQEIIFMRRNANSDLVMNNQILHFGTSNTNSRIRWSGTTSLWDLISGDLKIRDNTTDRFTFARTTGNFTATGAIIAEGSNEVWHPGNDGAGSGLDADLLDGLNSLQFLRSDTADVFSGDLTSSGSARIIMQKTDNNVSDHIQFWNGTGTRMGEIGCQDTTWLRINQVTNKNIYTPRYIRADAGFFVDGTTKGINGSGNFIGGTIAGASDYGTLIRSNADDEFSGNLTGSGTISITGSYIEVGRTSGSVAMTVNDGYGNANLAFNHRSGVPDVSGSSARIETTVDSTTAEFIFELANSVTSGNVPTMTETLRLTTSAITYASNTVWHAGNDGAGSGLDADLLDGYNQTTAATGNTIVRRNGSGDITGRYLYGSYVNMSHSAATRNGDSVFYSSTDDFVRKNTASGMRSSLGVPANNGTGATGTWNISITGDAGTVDGLNASQFLRSDTSDFSNGNITFNAGLTMGGSQTINHHGISSRDKIRVWNDASYAIGMHSSMTFGGLSDYAMTFQMNNAGNRGWVFLDTSHTDAQGAMALTTEGKMTVANSLRIGYGESDTTTPGATYRLDVSGDANVTGNVNSSSDVSLKENIVPIADALKKVLAMRGVEYDRIDMNGAHQVGVVAQEIEEVIPELVTEDEGSGLKSVSYGNITAVLIEAIKQQQEQINKLRTKLNEL